MDVYILFSALPLMYSWILCTALCVPAGDTPTDSTVTPGRHLRTKRCSCATFLDKECVYFCHLDIIWVNTPERVVSYGLGNAPRTRRAVLDSMATRGGRVGVSRCKCLRQGDNACKHFCTPGKHLGYEASADTVIRFAHGGGCTEAQCKHKLAADTGNIRSNTKQVSPAALRATVKTRLLLEKWRVRQRHRARAWEGESTAS